MYGNVQRALGFISEIGLNANVFKLLSCSLHPW